MYTYAVTACVAAAKYLRLLPDALSLTHPPHHSFTHSLIVSLIGSCSHKYLVETAAKMLGKPAQQLNAITCHLGNGSSIAAVKNGLSVDTTMGLTPLEG